MASGGLITDYLSKGSGAPSGAPSVVSGEYAFYENTANGDLYVWGLNGTPAWRLLSASGSAAIYPQTALILPILFKVVTGCGGSLSINANTSQYGDSDVYQTTPGNGDAVETAVMLDAATYDVYMLGNTSNNKGKLDWTCDGASAFISAQDWYSASSTFNVKKTGTLTIAASGRHLIRATVNGKNASSSNYYFSLSHIWLIGQSLSTAT